MRGDAHERAARMREVVQLISSEEDPTVRAMAQTYADQIAQRIGMTEGASFDALRGAVTRALSQPSSPSSAQAAQRGAAPPSRRARGNAKPSASPWQARSRDQGAEIGLAVLGCLLDFPDFSDDPASEEAIRELEGDAALCAAAIAAAHETGQKPGHKFSLDVIEILAHVPASIHTFAAERLASPRHEQREDAGQVTASNAQKLKTARALAAEGASGRSTSPNRDERGIRARKMPFCAKDSSSAREAWP